MALALSGQQLLGQTLMIQASQAEKNRAAAANKYKKNEKNDFPAVGNTLAPRHQHARREQNNRVYVGGLVGPLSVCSPDDIRQFFNPFGEIDAIEVPKDPVTQVNKGHAIVEFRLQRDAKIAAQSMNGVEVTPGNKLKVNVLVDGPNSDRNQEGAAGVAGARQEEDLGEDTTNTYLHSAQARTMLMQKLMGQKGEQVAQEGGNDKSQAANAQNAANQQNSGYIVAQPTHCLLFNNMFETKNIDLRKDPSFFLDIKDQIKLVCSEFGKIDKIYIEQSSDGNIWVKFAADDIKGAIRSKEALNQQFFDSRKISVNFVPETVFTSKYKER